MNDNKLCECGCGKEVRNRFCRGHSTRSKEIQQKSKITCLEKYGCENPYQSKEIQEKYKQTCISKYGCQNPNQLDSVKEKIKNSNIKKFGVNHSLKLKEFKDKQKITCLRNFGVEYPNQSLEIKKKSKQTCLEKYGVESSNQSDIVKIKKKETSIQNYGVENFSQTEEGKRISRETCIRNIETQKLNGEPLTPCIGNNERLCLDELQNMISFQILRNEKFIGYFVDGYIKELNLIIEFDESHHFKNGLLTDRDIQRQSYIVNHLKCNVLRIKDKEWINNKNLVISSFMTLVKQQEDSTNGETRSINT